MSAAHTPTPWRISRTTEPFAVQGSDAEWMAADWTISGEHDQRSLCEVAYRSDHSSRTVLCPLCDFAEAAANAEHIVRCVNAHDDLVAVLRQLIAWEDDPLAKLDDVIATARAALSKAAA